MEVKGQICPVLHFNGGMLPLRESWSWYNGDHWAKSQKKALRKRLVVGPRPTTSAVA